MQNRRFIPVLVLLVSSVAMAQSDKAQIAAESATRWLGYVDSSDYAKSWDSAAQLFQKAVSKADWEKQLTAIRGPLGAEESRGQVSATYTTQLPGVPDGEYVVVRYQSRFEKKRSAVETVTLANDRDKWRVAGYYIK